MALIKQAAIKGIPLEYWAIVSHSWNKQSNRTEVRVCVYKDKTARDGGVTNFINESSRVFMYTGEFTKAELYAKIKLEPFFVGSVDA